MENVGACWSPGQLAEWPGRVGALVELTGQPRLPVELARLLHDQFAADHIHIVRAQHYDRDLVLSASYDGSDTAAIQTKRFFDRNLQRFEHAMVTSRVRIPTALVVAHDHTQTFTSPEFRSFGREMDLGARCLIRKSEPQGDLTIVMLWSLLHGDVSHLKPDIGAMAEIFAPIVAKHFAICEDRNERFEQLGSIGAIEADLRHVLGAARRRQVQVGARLVAGKSAGEIADDLAISRETVISYRKRLYEHIGVETSRDLLLWYLFSTDSSPRRHSHGGH